MLPGPEEPLVLGIEKHFRKGWLPHSISRRNAKHRPVGIPVFGPSELAARMEGSKAFSKAFMERHGIPTAKFRTFSSTQFDDATKYVRTCGFRVVLKASGLAAGKGVLIPQNIDEAVQGLKLIMLENAFGAAGALSRFGYLRFL